MVNNFFTNIVELKLRLIGGIIFASSGGIIFEEFMKGIQPMMSVIGGLVGMFVFYVLQYFVQWIKGKISKNKSSFLFESQKEFEIYYEEYLKKAKGGKSENRNT